MTTTPEDPLSDGDIESSVADPAAVVYLASPASSWVTGQNILVAGGRTQRSYQYEPRRD